MKQNYKLQSLLLVLTMLLSINASSQTVFDLSAGTTTDSTPTSVSETLDGVTITITALTSGSANTIFVATGAGYGTNGVVAHNGSSTDNEAMNITFDTAVDVASIHVNATNSYTRTWTFTPTGGSNSAVMDTRNFSKGPHEITLNFTGVTAISITSSSAGVNADQIVYDKLTTPTTLSTDDVNLLDKNIKLYPNPTYETIQFSDLKESKNYIIYNVTGMKIKKGIISNNEQIDIRDFTNGLYLLKFEDGSTFKLIKE